jgi:hypothetical protein
MPSHGARRFVAYSTTAAEAMLSLCQHELLQGMHELDHVLIIVLRCLRAGPINMLAQRCMPLPIAYCPLLVAD